MELRHQLWHQITVPHSLEQNGVVERTNRTVIEKARCMLHDSKLNKKFWEKAELRFI